MRKTLIVLCCVLIPVWFSPSVAVSSTSKSEQLDNRARLSLAHSFVSKLKSRLRQHESTIKKARKNILPDGEVLLLQPVIAKKLRPEGVIAARVKNGKVLLSIRDFSDTLQMAIDVAPDGKSAQGWYVRENRKFSLKQEDASVKTAMGTFDLSRDVLFEDNDVWVSAAELGLWVNFDFSLRVDEQEIDVATDLTLPIYAQFLRKSKDLTTRRLPEPSLPLGGEEYGLAGLPVIDVSTRSTYRRNSGRDAVTNQSANVRTSSDFAGGTLSTQTTLNDQDQLGLVRARYSQDSLDGDLLGPLNAKRFEVGDIITTQVPFGSSVEQELGVRVTNIDAVRGFSRATTAISGNAIPGWDVEIYRKNQLLDFQTIGDDGFYQFSNVDLFQDDNTFRLVFYGLQGEIKEEEIFIPFDRKLLGQGRGIYDVSVTLDEKNTYSNDRFRTDDGENAGKLNIAALYEKPLAPGVTSTFAVSSAEDSLGQRNTIASAGISATVQESLVNASGAIDDQGAAAATFNARRDFGAHELSLGANWAQSDFSGQGGGAFSTVVGTGSGFLSEAADDTYGAALRLNGPVPFGRAVKARYSGNAQYDVSGGEDRLTASASLSGGYRSLSFSGGLRHEDNAARERERTNAFTTLSGTYGKNRVRLNANYEIKPDSELQSVVASYNRRFTPKIDGALSATRLPEERRSEFQARLDWQAGFIRLSPSIRYDTDREFFAGLNTSFGIVQDPSSRKLKFYDRGLTNFGLVSAFVYLDKNGDGIYNGEDEPLPDVTVLAPQNSRQETTDENGVALFNRMTRLRLTDVYVDKESLQDPSWISEFEGVSILPREGYVAQVEFPIHVSGEIDGTLYAKIVPLPQAQREAAHKPAAPLPLRNVKLALYNEKGEIEQDIVTDSGGFYYFSQIPPGRYLMMIDEESARRKNIIRPLPQMIEIGYDGTVMFGHDIYVETGAGDVPASIVADLVDYKAQHPHIDFHPDAHDVVLNLGEYNSRLLMSVVWYKLRSRFASILKGGALFVPPAQSYADVETGKHALRVGLGDASLDNAYARCRALVTRAQYCKVEIYPAAMQKASLE